MHFTDLGLDDDLMAGLCSLHYTELTPIQEKAIPLLMSGKDVIGLAPTGTGKTFAYAIPLIEKIDLSLDKVQGLVLVPTRELAIQSTAAIRSLLQHKDGIATTSVFGGESINREIMELKKHPKIIVATPGRLLDHLSRRTIRLDNMKMLVLDECDDMLSMGFLPDVKRILGYAKNSYQGLLFSATMNKEVSLFARTYLPKAEKIEAKKPESEKTLISQFAIRTTEKEKLDVLTSLLDSQEFDSCFVFVRTKYGASKLEKKLQKLSYPAVSLHGNLSQNKREKNMQAFRSGEAKILIATDIAARGIDVQNADMVVNYNIPDEDEYYVHRIGRTGRAGKTGRAYTFFNPDEVGMIKKYEKMTKAVIEPYKVNVIAKVADEKQKDAPSAKTKDVSKKPGAVSLKKEKREKRIMEFEKIAAAVKGIVDKGDPALKKEDLDKVIALVNDGKTEDLATSETVAWALMKILEDTTDPDDKKGGDENKADDNSTTQRLFINVGELDGFEDNDSLKKFIMDAVPSLKDEDFSDVYIRDKFAFVEVPKTSVDEIMKNVVGKMVGEREVHVELSEKKDASRGGGRGGRSFGGHRGGFGGGYGHSDRGGYGHSDRGGYGHSDRGGFGGGYGHSDRGGYGSSGYGHSDLGGFGGGYGHSDRGGYGHSDRGGYGHSDRGGYGHDNGGYKD
ncbi:MAG: DEAD/DEAH box helicase [Bacilli bacterium]